MLNLLGICGRHPSSEIAAPAKQGAPHYLQFSNPHNDQQFVWLLEFRTCMVLSQIMQAACTSRTKKMTTKIFATLEKAKYDRKYKRLKFGGSQGYNLSDV
jgi:hypothetical protein